MFLPGFILVGKKVSSTVMKTFLKMNPRLKKKLLHKE